MRKKKNDNLWAKKQRGAFRDALHYHGLRREGQDFRRLVGEECLLRYVERTVMRRYKLCVRFTGDSGDGDERTGLTQAGAGGSFDPVYSPPSRGACYQYAIVTEKTSTTKNVKICGTDRRERNVYTSRSNVVEVRFIISANVDTDKEYYFLLQFEGLSRLIIIIITRSAWQSQT